LIGGGTGPSDGSNATTVTPGPGNIEMMLRSFEGWPVNVGILGKGHGHGKAALVEQIEAGAVGFKCHEDWGPLRPCFVPRSPWRTKWTCRSASIPTH
jgi:urease subunit alpha